MILLNDSMQSSSILLSVAVLLYLQVMILLLLIAKDTELKCMLNMIETRFYDVSVAGG